MTGPMKSKVSEHDENLTEEEKRKLQSQQDKENQSREDHRRPNSTHDTHSQKDKQIAPEQRGKDSR
ncbi:hypothetical protein CWC33_08290 [Idiomarina sp. X4]|uniref:Uncharacterized protein n=1 Tax=Idiomarina piscisalsi TaxID=1096243 RepID=A0ABM6LRF9_9GAMM|nr:MULTISPECIES: hypothetical protein [Idiomarina]ASG65141.1 hypothetical protein CEW91_02790 [Idiomarina piscisalsi]ATZ73696.1 hypothetical protein CWC33_08290 [Idiomarina sp. X4]MTJ02173.1 hypothetical protein [Idiomarina piscisalsi]RXS42439.1 hypothetical protein EST55_08165 [Idiomarina sp. 29L]